MPLIMFGQVWTGLDKFGQIWTSLEHLDAFGCIWTCFDTFGRVWTHLDKCGPGLEEFGRCKEEFGEVWRSIEIDFSVSISVSSNWIIGIWSGQINGFWPLKIGISGDWKNYWYRTVSADMKNSSVLADIEKPY